MRMEPRDSLTIKTLVPFLLRRYSRSRQGTGVFCFPVKGGMFMCCCCCGQCSCGRPRCKCTGVHELVNGQLVSASRQRELTKEEIQQRDLETAERARLGDPEHH